MYYVYYHLIGGRFFGPKKKPFHKPVPSPIDYYLNACNLSKYFYKKGCFIFTGKCFFLLVNKPAAGFFKAAGFA
jgi:hypothetical protein